MRVAIVGSRSISMDALPILDQFMPKGVSEIVSGGAEGADQLAEAYARRNHLPCKVFRPDYERYHKSAPLQRNRSLIQYSDYVLVLWDGKSRGSANVIDTCIQEYTPVRTLLIRDGKLVETLFGQEAAGKLIPAEF
ncbi:MAG: SLOG family protein [Eubacteriales bacterium]|nr:SLOG family protein [Eubacteriales bacterium]